MRQTLIVSAVLSVAAWAGSVVPGNAAPFCLVSSANLGVPECLYHTWQQCRASVGGGGDRCDFNTMGGYVFDTSDPNNPRVASAASRSKVRARH
jgi:hypothetical protein